MTLNMLIAEDGRDVAELVTFGLRMICRVADAQPSRHVQEVMMSLD